MTRVRFSTFLENPSVSWVNRRMPIGIVRFCRSTYDEEMCLRSGSPFSYLISVTRQFFAGLYLRASSPSAESYSWMICASSMPSRHRAA